MRGADKEDKAAARTHRAGGPAATCDSLYPQYGAAYTGAFSRHPRLKKIYVDAFSGAGAHISKSSGSQIEGSPARALKISPPFDGFFFIDMNEKKTAHLKSLCGSRGDVPKLPGRLRQNRSRRKKEALAHRLPPPCRACRPSPAFADTPGDQFPARCIPRKNRQEFY